jgi:hypothetical protein
MPTDHTLTDLALGSIMSLAYQGAIEASRLGQLDEDALMIVERIAIERALAAPVNPADGGDQVRRARKAAAGVAARFFGDLRAGRCN